MTQENKIWKLERRHSPTPWDEIESGVVIASDAETGRKLMHEKERHLAFDPPADHGDWWLDANETDCETVSLEGHASVINVDVNNG